MVLHHVLPDWFGASADLRHPGNGPQLCISGSIKVARLSGQAGKGDRALDQELVEGPTPVRNRENDDRSTSLHKVEDAVRRQDWTDPLSLDGEAVVIRRPRGC